MKRPFLVVLFLAAASCFSQGDPATIAKILDEGKNRNQVMKHLEYLSTQIGSRLTGSKSNLRACEWAKSQFEKFGLTNCALEQWGTIPVGFQRGPVQIGRMIAPIQRDFEFTSRSWTPGTNGSTKGRAILEPSDLAALDLLKPLLKGAWVVSLPRNRQATDADVRAKIQTALDEAGIVGRVAGSNNELVITSGRQSGLTMDNLPKGLNITVRKSDRDAIIQQIATGKEVVLEFNMQNEFFAGPVPVYNVVAEIRGTEKPDEVVIVGGHLDSWDGPNSQGTLDNGTGTMEALEAARILMASGAKPKRTIRFVFFTGEEQGLLGSRAYVEKHKDEMAKISAVFIDDGGTNFNGGLLGIAAMEPMLKQAIAPVADFFADMPVKIRLADRMPRGGGSDHASFNAVGVPGFFWDEVGRSNYTYAHHTQNDRMDLAIPEYLVQSSTVSAVTAYNLACADTLLPRQTVPAGK